MRRAGLATENQIVSLSLTHRPQSPLVLLPPVNNELPGELRRWSDGAAGFLRLRRLEAPAPVDAHERSPHLRSPALKVEVSPLERQVLLGPHAGQQRELEDAGPAASRRGLFSKPGPPRARAPSAPCAAPSAARPDSPDS